MRQALETLFAPGDLINFCRLGFLMYWHRHGLCSLSLAQQAVLGFPPDVFAAAHGLSCSGLHVTAVATSTWARASIASARIARLAILVFIFLVCVCFFWWDVCVREREWVSVLWGICLVCGSIYRGGEVWVLSLFSHCFLVYTLQCL